MDNPNNNWKIVNTTKSSKKKSSPKMDICETYSKFGNCKCVNTNNKRHPFICSNIEKFGRCTFVNCRMFHPTQMKPKDGFFKNNNKNKLCHMWKTFGYCECVDKKNHIQHPLLCKDFINGICDNPNCDYYHIKKKNTEKDCLCSTYEEKGICKDVNCKQIHPPLCKIYKCPQGNNCKYFHPLNFPPICNSINLKEKCKHRKCYFYHPLVCQKEVCEDENCLLYHRRKVIVYQDVINWVENKNLKECILYYEENLKELIESYDEKVIRNVRKLLVKHRRYDILEYFVSIFENIILNKRRYNDNLDVYSELLWPSIKIQDEILFLEEFKKTLDILLKKKFDIFKFDNDWNESLFAVIKNENNKLSENLRIKLYDFFLNEWKDNDIILSSFKNMWNMISPQTKDKMWKYLIFIVYKNPEDCITYLSKNLFKSHGTQKTNNIKTEIYNIIELLMEYPKDNNDMYHIYVNVDWDNKIKEYGEILLDKLEQNYTIDEDNIYQNSLRYGTLLGLLYKSNKHIQPRIMNIISDFRRPNIIQIFIEFYEFSGICDDTEIVLKFKEQIYKNVDNNKDKFEIERKLGISN